jgi:hypothetical protein
MGDYINYTKRGVLPPHGKADRIITDGHADILIGPPKDLSEIPADKVLVCVVENGLFEAAGVTYNERELRAFTDPSDDRPKTWLIVPKEVLKLQPWWEDRAAVYGNVA